MKLKYDGNNVTFTHENLEDVALLMGFANLDVLLDYYDSPSIERLFELNKDSGIRIQDGISALRVAVDAENPPEDEDDDDLPEIPFITGAA